MEITDRYGKYGDYAAQSVTDNRTASSQTADNVRQSAAPQKVSELSEESLPPYTRRRESLRDYAKRLAKLVPSVEVRVGSTFPSERKGKTLTINPGLLNKMQNDPEQEKETKEMLGGVEMLTKWLDGMYKASGQTVVFRHSYIDADGKYRSFSCVRNDRSLKMSAKLRTERRKNADRLIQVTRKKAAKRRKELQDKRGGR
ncbi:MAG: hypothetical protein NC337_14140 [Roseburia sp.]|nr:hypothetical protein [Roseburia sp.]